jgi:hypothetical protein
MRILSARLAIDAAQRGRAMLVFEQDVRLPEARAGQGLALGFEIARISSSSRPCGRYGTGNVANGLDRWPRETMKRRLRNFRQDGSSDDTPAALSSRRR